MCVRRQLGESENFRDLAAQGGRTNSYWSHIEQASINRYLAVSNVADNDKFAPYRPHPRSVLADCDFCLCCWLRRSI